MVRADQAGHRHCELIQLPETSRDGNRLLEQIDVFFGSSQVTVGQLDRIAVCAGPGGFTRVRVACAVAQGLALARQLPVAPVHSMQAQAAALWMMHCSDEVERGNRAGGVEVSVLLDARMDQLYSATYRVSALPGSNVPEITIVQPPGLLGADSIDQYFDRLPAGSGHGLRLISGDGAQRFLPTDEKARLSAARWCGCVDNPVVAQTGAGEMALAALELADHAGWVPASQVRPFYLREKIALTIDEQAALRAANRAVRP